MQLSRAAVTALVVVLAAGLAGCATAPPQAPAQPRLVADPPELTAADRWDFEVTQTASGAKATLSMVVESTDAMRTVGNATYLAATVLNVTRQEAGGSHALSQLITHRRDLAQLHIDLIEQRQDIQGNRTSTFGALEYGQPCRQYPWPMQVGARLSERCDLVLRVGQTSQPAVQHVDVVVEAWEMVTVAAGTFEAFRLNVTLTTEGAAPVVESKWWAPAACGLVKAMQKVAEGYSTVELVAHQCAKPGQARPAASATV